MPPLKKQEEDFFAAVGHPDDIDVDFTPAPYYKDSSGVLPEDLQALVDAFAIDPKASIEEIVGNFMMHGTDTLAYAAFAAKMAGIPAVFSGAMKPSNSPNADGPLNARNAMLLAASEHPLLKGQTLVTMNNQIFDPLTVYKGHTTDIDAFKPGAAGRIGTIIDGKITVERAPVRLNTHFDLSGVKRLPDVVTFTCRPDITLARQKKLIENMLKLETASALDDAGDSGAYQKVLIVEAYGNGKVPDYLEPFLTDLDAYLGSLREQGVFVLRTSQVPEGEVEDQPSDSANRFINGGHLRADRLGLFTKFYLATARSEKREVSYDDLRAAVRLIQPQAQANVLS